MMELIQLFTYVIYLCSLDLQILLHHRCVRVFINRRSHSDVAPNDVILCGLQASRIVFVIRPKFLSISLSQPTKGG